MSALHPGVLQRLKGASDSRCLLDTAWSSVSGEGRRRNTCPFNSAKYIYFTPVLELPSWSQHSPSFASLYLNHLPLFCSRALLRPPFPSSAVPWSRLLPGLLPSFSPFWFMPHQAPERFLNPPCSFPAHTPSKAPHCYPEKLLTPSAGGSSPFRLLRSPSLTCSFVSLWSHRMTFCSMNKL